MHTIIKKIIKKQGQDVITSKILVNCIDDEGGFSDVEMRPYKKILKLIIDENYSRKLLEIGAWNAEAEMLVRTCAQRSLIQEEGVLYVFACLAYGLGWLSKAPKFLSGKNNPNQPKSPKNESHASANPSTEKSAKVSRKATPSVDQELRKHIEKGDLNRSGIKPEGDFIIPEGTTRIGKNAFYECDKLTSVQIPSTVKCIGACAFYHCKNLTNIVIPEGVESIGNRAFYCCSNLVSIDIPDSLKKVENEAFYLCRNLKKIIVPKGKKMAFRKMCPRDSRRPKSAQITERILTREEESIRKRIELAEKRALEAERREIEARQKVVEAENARRRIEALEKRALEAEHRAKEAEKKAIETENIRKEAKRTVKIK